MGKVEGIQIEMEDKLAFYKRLSKSGLPVFGAPSGLLIWEKVKPRLPKVVVITIPRSGTHFTSKLLQEMGLIFAGMHVAPSLESDMVQDRRSMQINPEGQLYWKDYNLPLEDVFQLLGPGQYIQGHVPYHEKLVTALADCKIIYARRNLRDVAVSAMRFIAKLKAAGTVYPAYLKMQWCELEDSPAKMIGYLRTFGDGLPVLKNTIEPWKDEPNAFVLDFDVLTCADNEIAQQVLNQLATFLNLRLKPEQLKTALQRTIGSETPSWSGKLSRWNDLWNDEVEALFQCRLAGEKIDDESDDIEDLVQETVISPQVKRHAVLSWLHSDALVTKNICIESDASPSNLLAEVLTERISANVQTWQISLQDFRDGWMSEGVALTKNDEWISISNLEGYRDHRHVTVPIAVPEAVTMLTFSLLVDNACINQHFVLQVGSETGFFNCTLDSASAKVSQIQHSGDCRSLCTRIDPAENDMVKVSMAGLIGAGKLNYVRIYLCDSNGVLDFQGQLELRVKNLTLSYGLEVFDFNRVEGQPEKP